jgi:hypothetical protein
VIKKLIVLLPFALIALSSCKSSTADFEEKMQKERDSLRVLGNTYQAQIDALEKDSGK